MTKFALLFALLCLTQSEVLILQEQKQRGKVHNTSTPKSTPNNTPNSRKDGKKAARKKTKATAVADEPTVLSFMEREQERDEAFMERMAEAERESRREQQTLSMDALKILKLSWKPFKGRCQWPA